MLKIAIDELATERQNLTGYTYVILNNNSYNKLIQDTAILKSTSSINYSFHGKKYKSNHKEAYKNFLDIIKSSIESSEPSLICVTLNTSNINEELNDFFSRLFSKVSNNTIQIEEKDCVVLKSIIPYILSLQRVSEHMNLSKMDAEIEIDSDDIKNKLPNVIVKNGQQEFTGAWYLKTFCNKYRDLRFPGAPSLTESIRPIPDSRSAFIQATDVFANFLLSHIFILSGHPSPKRKEKSDLLVDVFGDKIRISQSLLDQIKRVGKSDLDLDIEGAVTYRYGYQ